MGKPKRKPGETKRQAKERTARTAQRHSGRGNMDHNKPEVNQTALPTEQEEAGEQAGQAIGEPDGTQDVENAAGEDGETVTEQTIGEPIEEQE